MMMSEIQKLQREFYRLIVRGWKEQKRRFATRTYYDPRTGGYCALGVAAKVLEPRVELTGDYLTDHDKVKETLVRYWPYVAQNEDNVAAIQNTAASKNEAMRKIRTHFKI